MKEPIVTIQSALLARIVILFLFGAGCQSAAGDDNPDLGSTELAFISSTFAVLNHFYDNEQNNTIVIPAEIRRLESLICDRESKLSPLHVSIALSNAGELRLSASDPSSNPQHTRLMYRALVNTYIRAYEAWNSIDAPDASSIGPRPTPPGPHLLGTDPRSYEFEDPSDRDAFLSKYDEYERQRALAQEKRSMRFLLDQTTKLIRSLLSDHVESMSTEQAAVARQYWPDDMQRVLDACEIDVQPDPET